LQPIVINGRQTEEELKISKSVAWAERIAKLGTDGRSTIVRRMEICERPVQSPVFPILPVPSFSSFPPSAVRVRTSREKTRLSRSIVEAVIFATRFLLED
jgi:hypothetical protein